MHIASQNSTNFGQTSVNLIRHIDSRVLVAV